jgi:hypothetical protein
MSIITLESKIEVLRLSKMQKPAISEKQRIRLVRNTHVHTRASRALISGVLAHVNLHYRRNDIHDCGRRLKFQSLWLDRARERHLIVVSRRSGFNG